MTETAPTKKQSGAIAPWLVVCVLTGAIAAALDFLSARPAFWIIALPAGRAAIGAATAVFVLASAWLLRIALTRRAGAQPLGGAGDV